MSKPLLLLWTDGAEPYARAIEEAGLAARLRVETVPRAVTPDDALLAEAEALLSWGPPPGILARMPKLRFVQALTAGVEHWLSRPDLAPDVALACARGTHRVQMPENILGALFHITKPYAAIAADNAARRWTRRVSATLAGSTLGILGLGAIGAELARKAQALEMRVIGTKRSPGAVPHVERVFAPAETDAVLAESDFVVLLLPATPETENFIDAARLARMKKSAWLLNFGRGALIRDEDLVAAVRAGTIAGAIIDVFRTEPLPAGHPFWEEERIMVLPHIGGLHPQRDSMVAALLVENLRRFVEGAPLTQLVDRKAGY
ncbi:D-2-hydroxyacid dehydrogenase [Roseomonas alkaliterrae]|uniref:Phosphoglycerate dehydrogenase-like enzyme n=1 Tax=Neoroseomonas alkaliterrae TaxID=1452450 RepID=A0A840Y2U1_9PROT|nr:D-2-hydroxyacid dehydrogenase [Neoroseomonas alkaliterrae]MBB5688543.1 phosphoglycerate dehydrogenase-like enzyme [Neoroseomonas alkaliterrae]MBR0676119.1 D-2-hydroxyacid dehydrogenase [Neoroseomonas alkaliterrae]